VQSRASLLAGDDVELSVEVGEGAALELVELGAIVAHHVRDRAAARVVARVSVAAGGRLIWLGQPLVVGAGALASVCTTVSLGPGAVALRGEAVVLGRAGERCGSVVSSLRIELDGSPLVNETLDTACVSLRSPVVAGDATMIAAVTLAGIRDALPGAMQAHGAATLWRDAGASVEVAAAAATVAERWRRLVESYCVPEAPSPLAGAGAGSRPSGSAASSSQLSARLPRTDSKIVSP
jgi:urease accessory protein